MRGRICVVTGANGGIGLATARGLAKRGARVVMTARDHARGLAAVEQVKRDTGNEQVELLGLDLASSSAIRTAASELLARHPRIDVLVNNAGVILGDRRVTEDGIEATIAINHFGPFLLTLLLRERLVASAPARIVNVASAAHRSVDSIGLDDIDSQRSYRPMRAYARSKLANIMFTSELSERLAGSGVTAYSLHPGVVRSGFAADGDTGAVFSLLIAIARPFMRSPVAGARTSIYLASAAGIEHLSGQYFSRCRPARTSAAARDRAAQRALWTMSLERTGAPPC